MSNIWSGVPKLERIHIVEDVHGEPHVYDWPILAQSEPWEETAKGQGKVDAAMAVIYALGAIFVASGLIWLGSAIAGAIDQIGRMPQ
jgi:hypothetical protein